LFPKTRKLIKPTVAEKETLLLEWYNKEYPTHGRKECTVIHQVSPCQYDFALSFEFCFTAAFARI